MQILARMCHGGPELDPEWAEMAKKQLKGGEPTKMLWETPEGVTIKPLYTAQDVTGYVFLSSFTYLLIYFVTLLCSSTYCISCL